MSFDSRVPIPGALTRANSIRPFRGAQVPLAGANLQTAEAQPTSHGPVQAFQLTSATTARVGGPHTTWRARAPIAATAPGPDAMGIVALSRNCQPGW